MPNLVNPFAPPDDGAHPLFNQPAKYTPLSFPWAEFISRSGWTGDASFRPGEARVVMNILIYFKDLLTAVREILGYSVKDANNAGRINRHLPMQHPLFTWMWANAILRVAGVKFLYKAKGGAGPYSEYQYALLTVSFWSPPYRILPDFEVTSEVGRYVERQASYASDAITVDKGVIRWAASHAADGSPIAAGHAFHNQTHLLLTKVNYRLTWHQVPDRGLFSGNGFEADGVPTNIESCLNKINNGVFIGKPANTLRCDAPEFVPYTYPCEPSFINAKAEPTDVPRMWNVVYNLLYFKPPKGNSETEEGWNLAPDPYNGKWYKIQRPDGTTTIYEPTDFTNLFKLN